MTFQPASKSLTTRDYQFIALVVFVLLVVSTLLVYANLTLERGGGDFYVHWVGLRGLTVDHIEPYGIDVALRTQQLAYGTTAQAGDEPYILDTPLPLLLFYYPFSFLSDPMLARALFTLILELALFALVYLSLRLTDWDSPRLMAVLFILFGGFNFYAFRAIYEANPVLLIGLIYVGMIISLYAETDEFTGALLAISFYYWEVGAPFLLLVILRVIHEKRTRTLAGFLMVGSILLFISFLLYPDWLIPFWRAAFNNLRIEFGFNIFAVFSDLWPLYGLIVARVLVVGLLVLVGYEFSLARVSDFRQFYWASCLAFAAAPLLGLRTEMEHLVVLVIPLALIFAITHDRWLRAGNWLTISLMLLVFALPWAVGFFAVKQLGQIANEFVFLFLPVFTIVGLYWIRWWALRPPRVWADLANRP